MTPLQMVVLLVACAIVCGAVAFGLIPG